MVPRDLERPAEPTSVPARPNRDWWEDFGSPADPRTGWSASGAGERYESERWRNKRRRAHDLALVRALLEKAATARERLALPTPSQAGSPALVLDVPCGTARLRPVLEPYGLYVGLDVSQAMLERARSGSTASEALPAREVRAGEPSSAEREPQGGEGALVRGPLPVFLRGDVGCLPFRDGSFEAVVCCRLLHHLRDPSLFERVVLELARVSSRWVVASFFDAASLPALERRLLRRKGRISHSRRRVRETLCRAGASVVAWRHTLRFFSQQTFVLARKDGA